MKSWKTTVAGIAGGFLALLGPQMYARVTSQTEVPPIKLEQVILGGSLAALGYFGKDHDKTGGTR